MKPCTICDSEIQGAFCSNCGQKAGIEPIGIGSMLADFYSNFLSIESALIATLIALINRPSYLVHNYFHGNTGYYIGPGKMLFYSLVVIALHHQFVSPQILGLDINVDNVQSSYFFWGMILPLFIITSGISFIKNRQAFAKHIVSVTYFSSALLALSTIIFDAYLALVGQESNPIEFVLFLLLVFIYNAIALSATKSFWMVLGNSLIQIIVFVILLAIIAVFIYLIDPATLVLN